MFLYKIKEFWTKNSIKKKLSNVKYNETLNTIKTVGVIVDLSYFNDNAALNKELLDYGFENQNLHFIAFKNCISKKEVFDDLTFSYKDLSWNTNFNNNEIKDFCNKEFDLLISYYDIEKAPLMLLTHLSKAKFKVGFASIDNRLNHFLIETNAENFKVFVSELFKYLKILIKI